ncbi:MAG: helix-turn-helix transcriptional regulator [Chloroflexi bacterium]|nr:helix-turn-helix transcriptional regulator [Chloroflexota bacterium]
MTPRYDDPPGCRCHGGGVRGFIQARILLELYKKPAYGYELMEALGQAMGDTTPDPGGLYRTLRIFEEERLVRSFWDTAAGGPARRIYELTGEGVETLNGWAGILRRTRGWLDDFLGDYEKTTQQRSYEHVRAV